MADYSKHILVLMRETCDPRPPVRLTADGYGVRQRGLRYLANPADVCALEKSLQLASELKGKVTAVAIGPDRLDVHLRLALAMGADSAIRVWNPAFSCADAVAEARVIGRITEILSPDFVFTGNRLLDRGDNPAMALASAKAGLPYVTAALSIECNDGEVEVLRKSDRGATQVVGTKTPCTLMFEDGCCEPRYPDQDALMAAVGAQIETWGVAELGLPVAQVGLEGSALAKERCSFPRANPQRVVTPDANLPAFERILALLSGGIKPREGKIHHANTEETVEKLMEIFKSEGLIDGASQ